MDKMNTVTKDAHYYVYQIDYRLSKNEEPKDLIEEVIKEGGSIDAVKSSCGQTILMYAIIKEKLETFYYLLEQGADIAIQDNYNRTCLHYAATSDSTEMLKCLIEKGADVNARDMNNVTPLIHALMHKKLYNVDILLYSNVDVDIPDLCGQSSLYYTIEFYYFEAEREKVIRSVFEKSYKLIEDVDYCNKIKDYSEDFGLRNLVVEIIDELLKTKCI